MYELPPTHQLVVSCELILAMSVSLSLLVIVVLLKLRVNIKLGEGLYMLRPLQFIESLLAS
jgi:hypothetical protein